jgi:hypothetical protein
MNRMTKGQLFLQSDTQVSSGAQRSQRGPEFALSAASMHVQIKVS